MRYLAISVLMLVASGCMSSGNYARKSQFREGMTKEDISQINQVTPIYRCQRVNHKTRPCVFRYYLVDSETDALRPYLCEFSENGTLSAGG